MFLARYFTLLFELTPHRAISEGHISLPDQGKIGLEIQFDQPIPEAVTCLVYLEYNNGVRIEQLLTVSTDFNINGHGTDYLYPKSRALFSRRVSVRHSTASSRNEARISHHKYRSAYSQRNSVVSHPSRKAIVLRLFFRLLWLSASRPKYPDFFTACLHRLGI